MHDTTESVEKNVYAVICGLLKTKGIQSLYRGFGIVITGAILCLKAKELVQQIVFEATVRPTHPIYGCMGAAWVQFMHHNNTSTFTSRFKFLKAEILRYNIERLLLLV